jgi:malate synthase
MDLHLTSLADSFSDRGSLLNILDTSVPAQDQILTPESVTFISQLCRQFEPQRQRLLAQRRRRLLELEKGVLPDFPAETRQFRQNDWTVAPIPPDLRKRAVEITGPVERKMIINALNSGADVFMADFEDSNSPTWRNCIEGQIHLRDAVRRSISFKSPDGKQYQLNEKVAALMVRPRGLHLDEKHVLLDGEPVSASLFDFGLYFFHNALALISRGSGPYFYLPKIESRHEAAFWNDVFSWAEDELEIPAGTIRATVLIETILAAFEMDEILWELRWHSAGLNCGRWDYIFSLIKKFSNDERFVLSDRALVTMTTPFMRNYSLLAIKTCHRRGIHAIGGMAAQIPIKNDPAANEAALAKVRADKNREATDGHDGTWVAHPGLVPVAAAEFAKMKGPNQIDRLREDVEVSASDLLDVPRAPAITEEGVRTNIRVGIEYLAAWLGGLGCVPINNLMEDAATAEISRAQLWQWVHHRSPMTDGRRVTLDLVEALLSDEMTRLRGTAGEKYGLPRVNRAAELFRHMTRSETFPEFLTSEAYRDL